LWGRNSLEAVEVDVTQSQTLARRPRLLAISSGGGHWIELARISPALAEFDVLYASTSQGLAPPTGERPVRVIPDASRDEPLLFPLLLASVLRLLADFRPRIIVSTGAAPGLIALAAGKAAGCRTVWIDSIANAETLSLSGRLAARCADVRISQWPAVADANPGVRYLGRVL
jgi:UDP-N-acetylglucosamine:LPS N-acetylglucosamine transferase